MKIIAVIAISLAAIFALTAQTAHANDETAINVRFGDFQIFLDGADEPIEFLSRIEHFLQPAKLFTFQGEIYAPISSVAHALGARMNFDLSINNFAIWQDSFRQNPEIRGNSLHWTDYVPMGFLLYSFVLPITPESGVTWELVSLGSESGGSEFISYHDSRYLKSPEDFEEIRAEMTWGYISWNVETDAAIVFCVEIDRNVPSNYVFTAVFEQVLDGTRLGNFYIYEIRFAM